MLPNREEEMKKTDLAYLVSDEYITLAKYKSRKAKGESRPLLVVPIQVDDTTRWLLECLHFSLKGFLIKATQRAINRAIPWRRLLAAK